jgi:hypothetical protein
MIAAHYDEDHLRGLVPIVRAGIAIGDEWWRPVASIVLDEEYRFWPLSLH